MVQYIYCVYIMIYITSRAARKYCSYIEIFGINPLWYHYHNVSKKKSNPAKLVIYNFNSELAFVLFILEPNQINFYYLFWSWLYDTFSKHYLKYCSYIFSLPYKVIWIPNSRATNETLKALVEKEISTLLYYCIL